MARKVIVEPWDPNWRTLYHQGAKEVADALGDEVVAIHHIGSTAVPGLPAKPIIDILVAVHDVVRLDALDERMLSRGYRPRGENGIPGRRYYVKGTDDEHLYHVHAFRHNDPQVARHLTLVKYLRMHPQEVMAYGRFKTALAKRFPDDIGAYVAGKAAFMQMLDRRAAAWRAGTDRKQATQLIERFSVPSDAQTPTNGDGHRQS
ncbi:MAG: GrpB family protein [Anaerolineae bacterium]|jgi:GrpB-like predicted nucleotidyltransferase (UPF0157 family)